MECIEKVAGDIEVFGEGHGIRHIHAWERLQLLVFVRVVRQEVIKVRLDGDSEGNIRVVEEGKPENGLVYLTGT